MLAPTLAGGEAQAPHGVPRHAPVLLSTAPVLPPPPSHSPAAEEAGGVLLLQKLGLQPSVEIEAVAETEDGGESEGSADSRGACSLFRSLGLPDSDGLEAVAESDSEGSEGGFPARLCAEPLSLQDGPESQLPSDFPLATPSPEYGSAALAWKAASRMRPGHLRSPSEALGACKDFEAYPCATPSPLLPGAVPAYPLHRLLAAGA